MNLENVLEK